MSNLYSFPPNLKNIYNEEFANQLANTQGAISSLNHFHRLLHNPELLMHPILSKEAESSSQLEGTQASIEDAYKIDILEQTPEARSDAIEIINYENAMRKGLTVLENYDLNNFVIREIHKTLLQEGRGERKSPGEFRKGDAWIGKKGTKIGEARYVAPDALQIDPLMNQLVNYINTPGTTHPLIVAGILHHRFEAIHPFEDGNGRTGRLLISLYFIKKGLLKLPILYPSGYFEKNRDMYLDMLSAVDKNQDWYSWLIFFLKALENQARLALSIGEQIDNLYRSSREKVKKEKAFVGLISVLEYMFTSYFVTAPIVNKNTGIALTSCKRYLEALSNKKIIVDIGLHSRQRVYANINLLKILKEI
jgi:Fic family protein